MKVRALTKKLSEKTVQRIKMLLAKGELSNRRIAKKVRVSRLAVYRIAKGLRIGKRKIKPEEWEVDRTGQPFVRCLICGAKTQMPCALCLIRNLLERCHFERFPDEPYEPVKLELEGRHQQRYEEVRAWREKLQDPTVSELPSSHPLGSASQGERLTR